MAPSTQCYSSNRPDVTYAETTQMERPKSSPYDQQLQIIQKEFSALESELSELASKLSPVLTPERPEPVNPSPDKSCIDIPGFDTHLIQTLYQHAILIRQNRNVIVSISGRLVI